MVGRQLQRPLRGGPGALHAFFGDRRAGPADQGVREARVGIRELGRIRDGAPKQPGGRIGLRFRIGASQDSTAAAFGGRAFVYSGSDGSLLHTVSGGFLAFLGTAVAGLGDDWILDPYWQNFLKPWLDGLIRLAAGG
jgi:hypothetical protein